VFLFFVSFYWTSQVITNVVHVTTAGTVGTCKCLGVFGRQPGTVHCIGKVSEKANSLFHFGS
jgi:hypothetical protein